jgi:lipoic acid synthetase
VRDPRCDYALSLRVLSRLKALAPRMVVKSSLLVGLGETDLQIERSLDDLRAAGVDWVTLGQYLRPTRAHAPVQRYVAPEAFERLGRLAREKGFSLVGAGPLVRSSYRAGEEAVESLLRARAAPDPV